MRTLRIRRRAMDGAFAAEIAAALGALGVQHGEEFTLASRTDYNPGELPTDNHAVRGKTAASAAAAADVFPRTGTKRWQVIAALAEGPAVRSEIVARTRMLPNTARPRILEALDGGWIRQSVTQPTIDGNEVLELTDKGRAALGVGRLPQPMSVERAGQTALSAPSAYDPTSDFA